MAKKIVMSSGCIACGLCLTSPYMEEQEDGTAKIKGSGIIQGREEEDFQKTILACPAKVLSIEAVLIKSKDTIIQLMKNDVESFVLPEITIKDIPFDEKHIMIDAPVIVPGEHRYEYSSYNAAKRAAENAIDKAMFSQRKMLIQNVINNYSMDKLSPYIEYREVDDNFYYQANKKAQKILDAWIREIHAAKPDLKFADTLLTINTKPNLNKDYGVEFIKKYLFDYADVIVREELSGSYYNLSSYADNCDIDDEEVYSGRGMFGRDKYVTKYCFYNTESAFKELKNDLISACKGSFTDVVIERGVLGNINYIIKSYSKLLQEELKAKARELSKIV